METLDCNIRIRYLLAMSHAGWNMEHARNFDGILAYQLLDFKNRSVRRPVLRLVLRNFSP